MNDSLLMFYDELKIEATNYTIFFHKKRLETNLPVDATLSCLSAHEKSKKNRSPANTMIVGRASIFMKKVSP
ncbi:MAG: hypothetical protein K9J37_03475 [Saprospiraceae bacterium]|nr:hypothetical protein [Saprospiraceae bacterium]MCF8248943.1 hypothetical protein [Saprospiraceae bacterium]MCF8279154.1 hypothetical protein [Bacteroidales bacterium]MCF8310837.1 hypothetical protein [Saprospiraceae bacterium]MCF8439575.1 hypothetical protein [Saprospiraceae bacterium]